MFMNFHINLLPRNLTIALVLFILLVHQAAQAQPQPHLIWEVHKDGKSFWLAGVAHFVEEKYADIPASFEFVYANSSTIVPESIFYSWQKIPKLREGYQSQPTSKSKALAKTLHQDGFISAATAQALLEKPIEEFFEYYDAVLHEVPAMASKLKLKEGFDATLTRRAVKEKKAVDALETRWRRHEIWATVCAEELDRENILSLLDQTIRQGENFDAIFLAHQSAVFAGNLELVTTTTERWKKLNGFLNYLNKCSVVPRNNEWLKAIPKLLEKHSKPFFLVGTMHLVGSNNLLELLKNDGYEYRHFKLEEELRIPR
jgi:uncharacterized protein YbaP (TraB family)